MPELTPDEINAEIAHLKGWRYDDGWRLATDEEFKTATKAVWNRDGWWIECPDWTDDIGAAMTLLQEARLHCGYYDDDYGRDVWYCSLNHSFIQDENIFCVDFSLPVAICRAYLAWKKAQP